ncbi:MAG: CbbQ/NirQ/NorQ/GpvN family protein, partial [Candidatus Competibacterales bacterium]
MTAPLSPAFARTFDSAPYYQPVGDEVALFEAAFAHQLPVMLKGPTGCGKTRFVEYMAHRLGLPLVSVACHDDLSAADLVGRYLIRGGDTVWADGPLTEAVRLGGICYLDEVVEARKDTTVVIHPLCDDRRQLPIEKRGELLLAPPSFCLVVSFNPGYQNALKDLKQSTRQRFVALGLDYPRFEVEAQVIATEAQIELAEASNWVRLGQMTRNLKGNGLDEGASTRLLVHAARLVAAGITPQVACRRGIFE